MCDDLRVSSDGDELIVSDDEEAPPPRLAPVQTDRRYAIGRARRSSIGSLSSCSPTSPSWNEELLVTPGFSPVLQVQYEHEHHTPELEVGRKPSIEISPIRFDEEVAVTNSDEESSQEDAPHQDSEDRIVLDCLESSIQQQGSRFRWRRLEALSVIDQALQRPEDRFALQRRRADQLFEAGKYALALPILKALQENCKDVDQVGEIQYQIGLAHRELGNLQEMEKWFVRVLSQLAGKDRNQAFEAHVLSCLGNSYIYWERLDDAIHTLKKCHVLREAGLGADHPKTLSTLQKLEEAQRLKQCSQS